MLRHDRLSTLPGAANGSELELDKLREVLSPDLAARAGRPKVPKGAPLLSWAATGDRLVTPDQVRDLWMHWDRPRIAWSAASHLSALRAPEPRALLREALQATRVEPKAEELRWRRPRRSAATPSLRRVHAVPPMSVLRPGFNTFTFAASCPASASGPCVTAPRRAERRPDRVTRNQQARPFVQHECVVPLPQPTRGGIGGMKGDGCPAGPARELGDVGEAVVQRHPGGRR